MNLVMLSRFRQTSSVIHVQHGAGPAAPLALCYVDGNIQQTTSDACEKQHMLVTCATWHACHLDGGR